MTMGSLIIFTLMQIWSFAANMEAHSDFTVHVLYPEHPESLFTFQEKYFMSPRFRSYIRSKQDVIMGDMLKLNCAAVGKPLPYVHWYRNGQIIVPASGSLSKDLQAALLHPGQFNLSSENGNERIKVSRFFLKINKIVPGDEGEYACKVWNQAGQIWRNFTVHIVDLPQKPYYDSNQFGFVHGNDRKQLEIWLGEPLDHGLTGETKNDGSWSKAVDENSAEYNNSPSINPNDINYLNNLPMSDGSLNTNNRNNLTARYVGVNQAAPYWTKNQNNMQQIVAVPAGRMIKLTCRANGKPEPQIIWYKDNVEIKPDVLRQIGLKYQIKKWALVMEDAVPSDMGLYTCMAFNKYGNISHNYTVEIVERLPVRPIISPDYPKNATVRLGENATFECPLLSDLQPHIQWFKHIMVNGSYVNEEGEPHWQPILSDVFDGLLEGGDGSYLPDPTILFIRNVTEEDAGLYTCLTGNQIGLTYGSAYLTILQPQNETAVAKTQEKLDSTSSSSFIVPLLILVVLLMFLVCFKCKRRTVSQDAEKGIDPQATDQTTLLPKSALLSPRYLGNGLKQEFNFHFDCGLTLDNQWEISRDDISLIKSCGEGAFGQVFMGELRLRKCQDYCRQMSSDDYDQSLVEQDDEFDHVIVAVKMLKDNATRQEFSDLISEMQVMKQVCQAPKHPNVIDLIGCCTQGGPLYIIFEYCGHGNLLNFLRDLRPKVPIEGSYEEPNSKRSSKKLLTTQDLVQFALQIARGMKYLSEKKCIHRDLAARNVLVAEDYVLKIADFGLARDIAEDDYYRKETDGRVPVKWMAPECLSDKHYTVKSDVWSYGVLLWEIMTLGGKPFLSVHPDNLYQVLKQGQRLCQPHNCPDEIYALMLTCWQDNPDDRWSFAEIEKFLEDLITSNGDEYVEVIPDHSETAIDDCESHFRQFVAPLEKISDGLVVPDARQYFLSPPESKLNDDNVDQNENQLDPTENNNNELSTDLEQCRQDLETTCRPNYLHTTDDCFEKPTTDFNEKCANNDERYQQEEMEESCETLGAMVNVQNLVFPPSTLWAWKNGYGFGANSHYSYNHSPLPSPLSRTPLRPISEISELYGLGTDEEDCENTNGTHRQNRPSATDSGNPSSPGCSFEGSSDSMDSKCSSSSSACCPSAASSGIVFDSKLKRHSDPAGEFSRQRGVRTCSGTDETLVAMHIRPCSSFSHQMTDCVWPVPTVKRPYRRRISGGDTQKQRTITESDWSNDGQTPHRVLSRLNSHDSGHATSSSTSSDSVNPICESTSSLLVALRYDDDINCRDQETSCYHEPKRSITEQNDHFIPILSKTDKSDYVAIFVDSRESIV